MNPQIPPTQPVPPTQPIAFPRPNKKLKIAVAVLAVLLVIALSFGFWAFSGRQDYKNNTDKKISAAVANAERAQATKLQAQYDEQAKSPYKTFTSGESFGSISFQYPKSWSAYIDQTAQAEPINGYFYPDIVPGTTSSTAFALRVELTSNDYSSVVDQYQTSIQAGTVKASAYMPPKMKNVKGVQVGLRLDGTINSTLGGVTQNGEMIVLQVRDKTLQIYTESNKYLPDLTKVLASLSYNP